MDLPRALAYLDAHINLEAVVAGRHRRAVARARCGGWCDVLGDPQHAYPVIHITGTNGKGSAARMIATRAARGPRPVGRHLHEPAPRADQRADRRGTASRSTTTTFADVIERDRGRSSRCRGRAARYFELLTAAAFRGSPTSPSTSPWSRSACSVASTPPTSATATVAVVTNVGRDHTDSQGDWRATSRARRPASSSPESTLVLGETEPGPACRSSVAGAARPRRWERDATSTRDDNLLAVGGRLLDLRTPRRRRTTSSSCRCTARTRATTRRPRLPRPRRSSAGRSTPTLVADGVRERRSCRVGSRSWAATRSSILDGAHNPDGADVRGRGGRRGVRRSPAERIFVVGLLRGRDPATMLEALDAASDADLVIATAPATSRGDAGRGDRRAAASLDVDVEVGRRDVADAVTSGALDESTRRRSRAASPDRCYVGRRGAEQPPRRPVSGSAPVPSPAHGSHPGHRKPDAVERGLVGEIVGRFERRGLPIVALELRTVDARHRGRALRGARRQALLRRPDRRSSPAARSWLMVVEGPEDTWKVVRTMMGATNPREAAPGTIRGDLGDPVHREPRPRLRLGRSPPQREIGDLLPGSL